MASSLLVPTMTTPDQKEAEKWEGYEEGEHEVLLARTDLFDVVLTGAHNSSYPAGAGSGWPTRNDCVPKATRERGGTASDGSESALLLSGSRLGET